MNSKNHLRELPTHKRTIKADIRVWNALKQLKSENETYNDVIKRLLNQRTISMGNDNVKAIKYSRKVVFLELQYYYKPVALEFEYNDVKSQREDFTLDLKIKKIFYGKKVLNPSTFFGLDDQHKHLYTVYLILYLKCVALALEKEFRVSSSFYGEKDFENIVKWKKIYSEYSISEESFIHDIEEPLRLSEEETLTGEFKKRINESTAASIWGTIE